MERKPEYPEKMPNDALKFVGCLTSHHHASVSQGRICSDNFTCCHTEIEVADQTFHLTQSQYTDTGPTSPNTDPTTVQWYDSTLENSPRKRDSNPRSSAHEADALINRPSRRSLQREPHALQSLKIPVPNEAQNCASALLFGISLSKTNLQTSILRAFPFKN